MSVESVFVRPQAAVAMQESLEMYYEKRMHNMNEAANINIFKLIIFVYIFSILFVGDSRC